MIDLAKVWEIFISKFDTFMQGTVVTLELAFFTVLLGFLLGMIVAVFRRTKIWPLRILMNVYVAFIRGTPLLVQVLIIVYGMPFLAGGFIDLFAGFGIDISGSKRMILCIIALVINSGAYMAEIIRAGLQSVDRGQSEAADSLGMNGLQKMTNVILPQAIKMILPSLGNEFVVIIKESSVLYAVGVYELTYQAYKLASVNYRYLETLIVAALIYFVLTYVASKLLALLERRMRRGDNKIA